LGGWSASAVFCEGAGCSHTHAALAQGAQACAITSIVRCLPLNVLRVPRLATRSPCPCEPRCPRQRSWGQHTPRWVCVHPPELPIRHEKSTRTSCPPTRGPTSANHPPTHPEHANMCPTASPSPPSRHHLAAPSPACTYRAHTRTPSDLLLGRPHPRPRPAVP
jgi:hypothetical protein